MSDNPYIHKDKYIHVTENMMAAIGESIDRHFAHITRERFDELNGRLEGVVRLFKTIKEAE